MSEVIELCRINNDTGYLIADRKARPVDPRKISHQLLSLRDKLNVDWVGPPASFDEIRSLSARVYAKQEGSEFAQTILGHKSPVMTDKYRDSRGSEWTSV